MKYDRPHLEVRAPPSSHRFTSVNAGGGREEKRVGRDPKKHGTQLKNEFDQAVATAEDESRPVRVTFQSEPGFDLELESMSSKKENGFELLAVRREGEVTFATVLFPVGALKSFRKKFEGYITEATEEGTPRHNALLNSVATIRRATLKELWTELGAELPADGGKVWFELWVRTRQTDLQAFERTVTQMGLERVDRPLTFIDRTVVLVGCTTKELELLLEEQPAIAEVRLARVLASEFTQMKARDQRDWIDDLVARTRPAEMGAPAVCLVDTGVNRGHALLSGSLAPEDMHACVPTWGVDDRCHHGTELAGVALYGDLADVLSDSKPVELTHRLESVKILQKDAETEPHQWGSLTIEGVARAAINAPTRSRVVSLAVTAEQASDNGRPSSWSAALDKLAAGLDGDEPKVVCVSAGNVELDDYLDYPSTNETQGVFDPAQAWNALTVGAVANRTKIVEKNLSGWQAVAPNGDLAPSTSTSLVWDGDASWPIKPDILMDGGNAAIDPIAKQVDTPDSLGLLTTHALPIQNLLSVTRDTSAATALAARLAARLHAHHPGAWPETIRGLIVHSAQWTPQMLKRYPVSSRDDMERRLRCCGYGVPNEAGAFFSAANDATLMVQQPFQPFTEQREDGKRRIVTNEMHLHRLPWSSESLRGLGDVELELRVTLSYFIEPSPGQRGSTSSYRYGSFGLRFDLKTPTDDPTEFLARINKQVRDGFDGDPPKSDSKRWTLGPDLRAKGSVHSDTWSGSAAELAEKNLLAVYPAIGWWKERHHLGRWNEKTRYALIISVRAKTEVDIYTPIMNEISVPVTVAV